MNIIHGFGVSAFNVVLQPFIVEFTGSLFFTGIIISISSIMQFLPMPFIGILSDKYGLKKIWLFGPPIYAFGLMILIITNNIPILIIGVLTYMLGAMVHSLNFQLFVSENSGGSKKGIMYGLVFFAFFGGSIGGTSLVMLDLGFSFQFYFQVFLIILIMEWLILVLIIRCPNAIKKHEELDLIKTVELKQKKATKLFQNSKIKIATIFFTLDVFVWSIALSIYNAGLTTYYHFTPAEIASIAVWFHISNMVFQIRLTTYYHFTPSEIASIAVWFHISNMVFQIPAGKIADKIGKKKCLIISQFFGMVFFSMNILISVLWSQGITGFAFPGLIIGEIFFGVAVTTFIPSEQMTLTNLDDSRKAESYGIVAFIRGIGMMPTGAIGGFLAESVHYIAPFAVGLVGLVFEIWFLAKYFKD
jgi:MFS family permease